MGARTAKRIFWTAREGLVKYRTSSNARAKRAACKRLGIPLAFVLPSWARPKLFRIASSNLAPGRISTTTCASSSPAFHQSCTIPGGTCSLFPGPAPVEPEANPPVHYRERFVDHRVDVLSDYRPTWSDVKVGHQEFSAGLLRAYPHHPTLAGDRVLENVSRLGHAIPLFSRRREHRSGGWRRVYPPNCVFLREGGSHLLLRGGDVCPITTTRGLETQEVYWARLRTD